MIPIALVAAARSNWTAYAIGAGLAVFGQIIRVWAAGHLYKTETLAVGGPFAHVRNPLYVGTLIMGLGYCTMANNWWFAVPAGLLYYAVHWPTILKEEKVLAEVFGEPFQRYLAAVPRLIWKFRRYPEATGSFSWDQVWTNHEYRSMIGLGFAVILFAARIYFS